MAPPTKEMPSTNGNGDEKLRMLKEAIKCISGTVDFDELAVVMGVANGEAMRKRFKRFFEKDEVPLQLTGSTLGTPIKGAAPVVKTPRTPKPKSAAASSGDADGSPRARSTGRKRKAEAVSKDYGKDDADSNFAPRNDNSSAEEDAATNEAPKRSKSIKTATSKPTNTPKVAAIPETPKECKTPKALRTPKSAKQSKVVVSGEVQEATSLKGNDAGAEPGIRIGSPEVQAKTDGTVKGIGKESGETVGELEKQVVNSGSEKAVSSTDGY